jgi:hypothetical protein
VTFPGERYRHDEIPPFPEPGVYAFFIRERSALEGVQISSDGLLYIGMTASNLDVRNHFFHRDSSFSSFRRSLGALLKARLKLHAIPRGHGKNTKDFTHYRFIASEECKLTKWMEANLEYAGRTEPATVVSRREEELILNCRPPLNLNRWKNPQAVAVKRLRAVCRDEAKHFHASTSGTTLG